MSSTKVVDIDTQIPLATEDSVLDNSVKDTKTEPTEDIDAKKKPAAQSPPVDKTTDKADDKGAEKTDDAKEDKKTTEEEPEYYQDKDGNVVDDKGNIIVPKDKVTFDDEGNVIVPEDVDPDNFTNEVVTGLETKYGIKFADETGKPIAFDPTQEGIMNLVETALEKVRTTQEAQLFKQAPIIGDFAKHVLAGNAPETFIASEKQNVKYTLPEKTDNSEEATAIRKDIVIEEQLIKNGYYSSADENEKKAIKARAVKIANLLEDSKELTTESEYAYNSIESYSKKLKAEQDAANTAAIQKQREEDQKYLNNLVNTVKKRDLKGITIPENKVNGFIDYLTKPVADGKTKEMLDIDKEPLETSLQVAYLRYLGFDYNSVVKSLVANAKADDIKTRKIKLRASGTGRTDKPKTGGVDLDSITVDNLLV